MAESNVIYAKDRFKQSEPECACSMKWTKIDDPNTWKTGFLSVYDRVNGELSLTDMELHALKELAEYDGKLGMEAYCSYIRMEVMAIREAMRGA